ncbi:MAG: cell wall-active antibiotics response protein [Clostridia bacterium]|nr:cell wall-active antibiotics response protein [Clostridia bacterium]
MEKLKKSLWGIVFIALGIIIGLRALGIVNINIFFNGWWTLFIIVPCFIGLFDNEGKTGNIIGLVIGIALLLGSNNIISFDLIGKLFVPFILVAIGLSMLFRETIKSNITKKVEEGRKGDTEYITATFSGQKAVKDGEDFKSANLDAVFGAVTLDLRQANIEKEAVIKASAIFGGIEIFVPQDVNVKVKATPIFGGVSNKALQNKDSQKTIYIDAFCMFGGVEIK